MWSILTLLVYCPLCAVWAENPCYIWANHYLVLTATFWRPISPFRGFRIMVHAFHWLVANPIWFCHFSTRLNLVFIDPYSKKFQMIRRGTLGEFFVFLSPTLYIHFILLTLARGQSPLTNNLEYPDWTQCTSGPSGTGIFFWPWQHWVHLTGSDWLF